MEIKMSDMISRVLKNLDENEEIILEKMEFGYPETGLPSLIAGVIPEVAEKVMLNASLKDIDEWLEMDGDIDWIEPGHGEVELPKDFLRLISFRMSDWKRSVSSVVFADSDNYPLIFSRRRRQLGLRCAPAVALTNGATRRRLEFIGSNDPGAFILRATYLPSPFSDDKPDTLWIPRSLVADVAQAAADAIHKIRA